MQNAAKNTVIQMQIIPKTNRHVVCLVRMGWLFLLLFSFFLIIIQIFILCVKYGLGASFSV